MESRKPRSVGAAVFVFGATYVCAAALYVASAARGPSGDDWGDFVAAASVLGIAHPTGYPVFLHVLALPLLVLPRLWAAAAANIADALMTAWAPALLSLWVFRFAATGYEKPGPRVLTVLMGVFAAGAPALWIEGTAVEVYGAGLAVFFGVLLLVETARGRNDDRLFYAAALLCGLAPGFHMTTFIYAAAALLVGVAGRPSPPRKWLFGAAAAALGLSAFLYLPLRAASHPPLKWTWSAVNDLSLLVNHVAGRQFSYNFRWPSVLIIGYHLGDLGAALWRNLGPLVALAPPGLWLLWRRERAAAAAVTAALGLNVFFLLVYDIPDLARYQLPAVALALACAAVAVNFLWQAARRARYRNAVVALTTAAVAVTVFGRWRALARDGGFMDFYGRSLVAPQGLDAAYMTGDTTSNFLVWFTKYALGQRPDVTVYNLNDERYDLDKLATKMWTELGARPVFADYFFVTLCLNKDAFYRRARPAGFVVEITPAETPPGVTTRWAAAAEREAEKFLRATRREWEAKRRAREYAVSVFENRGFFHEARGEMKTAEYYFVKGVRLAPAMGVPRANLARWYWVQGDYEKARRESYAALAVNREGYGVYGNLVAMDLDEGKLDAALADARRAVALKPQDGKTHTLLARAYLARGEKEAARRELERTLARKYDDPDTVLVLAQLYEDANRDDDAFALLAKYAHRHNDPRLANTYALALIERGRYPEAKRELVRAARIAPGAPEIQANLARLEAMGW